MYINYTVQNQKLDLDVIGMWYSTIVGNFTSGENGPRIKV